jgi:hypothetical protein
VRAITGSDGKFTLTNVPVGANIPLVIQVGRWRRQITINNVPACVTTQLTAEQTRLPRTKAEGDIPKLALTTGDADSLECLLRKVGIDESEITLPTQNGRVHFYRSNGSQYFEQGYNGMMGNNNSRRFPDAATLWDDQARLDTYDAILLSCEGGGGESTDNAMSRQSARTKVKSYLDRGGRAFASHWHHQWVHHGPGDLPTVATFDHRDDLANSVADINTAFPKGAAFAQWLVNAGSAQPVGKISLTEVQHTVTAADPNKTTTWISIPQPKLPNGNNVNVPSIQYFTANTPVEKPAAEQCGRIVVSDLHVSGNVNGDTYPAICNNNALTDQEKALIFMLFDLTACVTDDTPPPVNMCTPKTCAEQGINCGPAGDGCGGLIANCGTCPGGQSCGGGGPGKCGGGATCTKRSCAELNANCGAVADGCGGLIDCGVCTAGTCGGGGTANQCGGNNGPN